MFQKCVVYYINTLGLRLLDSSRTVLVQHGVQSGSTVSNLSCSQDGLFGQLAPFKETC